MPSSDLDFATSMKNCSHDYVALLTKLGAKEVNTKYILHV
jgi:hypothetical protein